MRIDTSSIEIGSSARITLRLDGERARDRDALPLPARELVRVLLRDLVGRHETDARKQLAHAPVDRAARADPVDQQRPRDVVVDALDRIERRERILEDHLHAASDRRAASCAAADRATSSPSNTILPSRRRIQAREQARDGALAAAALAHERGHATGAEREGHVGHRVAASRAASAAPAHREALAELLHLERASSVPPPSDRRPGGRARPRAGPAARSICSAVQRGCRRRCTAGSAGGSGSRTAGWRDRAASRGCR